MTCNIICMDFDLAVKGVKEEKAAGNNLIGTMYPEEIWGNGKNK